MHPIRLQTLNEHPIDASKPYILYWMTSARRPTCNFALEHAIELANQHNKGLIVFEGLRMDYRWASDRFHQFVREGMRNNQHSFSKTKVTYIPCLETPNHPIKDILWSLIEQAASVVTDYFPAFFLPKMTNLVAQKCPVQFQQVDGNGIYPIWNTDKFFTTAHSFRRHLQKTIQPFLTDFPLEHPSSTLLQQYTPTEEHFDATTLEYFQQDIGALDLATLPIDHTIAPIADRIGGHTHATVRLKSFIQNGLTQYDTDRQSADNDPSSGLSPYLHFGHISAHEMVQRIWTTHNWTPDMTETKATGSRAGWWNLPSYVEAFLDQIITWRDLGFVYCHHDPNYATYESLPEWARITMEEHLNDTRTHIYDLQTFEKAQTHDPIWNAAQRQLIKEGRMHNYLRMLWAKKVLHWTKTPQDAIQILEELNNKYALDGRDPNSYSGIMWTFGRFDRAWTERVIFGKIRYMTSDSTKRKMKLKNYLQTYGPAALTDAAPEPTV